MESFTIGRQLILKDEKCCILYGFNVSDPSNYSCPVDRRIPDPETHHVTTRTVRLVDHGLHG